VALELSADARKESIASIRRYFTEELDLDIGELKADLLLNFFLKEIAPTIHNGAIERAQVYLRDRLADLASVGMEDEFGYWAKSRRK
jgi:uncharacterized protein (DUF2164 family)